MGNYVTGYLKVHCCCSINLQTTVSNYVVAIGMFTMDIHFQRKWPVSLMHLLDMTQAQTQSLDKPVQRRQSKILTW